jgi:hypothetical protein
MTDPFVFFRSILSGNETEDICRHPPALQLLERI